MLTIDDVLRRLEELIRLERFEPLETDTLEIKPVPPTDGSWKERERSVNAFLNTRGGILILGVKEVGSGATKKYVVSGWDENIETRTKAIAGKFTNRQGQRLDLSESFPPLAIRSFLGGQIGILYVDELPADRKYVFYEGKAYKRIGTGDQKLSESEVLSQEEYREEAIHARELRTIPATDLTSLDLDKLNDYIARLNRPVRVEMIKPSLESAIPFLTRKCFLREEKITLLGMLVCGAYPGDTLGFRCQVHGYVDIPGRIVDKQDFVDNVLPLMESSYNYVLRNIHVGVDIDHGGVARTQYPDELLRETVNNALAHRDYSVNKQAIIVIKPGQNLSIRNPGAFPPHLLIEAPHDDIPIRRIIPEAKPRNPKLADVLRVYRKWEGRGIGMTTMVGLCLENKIDLPYYRFYKEEVELVLRSGKLVGDRMERHFQAFDGYTREKLQGNPLTDAQKRVLAYIIKSEWDNLQHLYTILLTPDNNHFRELHTLEKAGLLRKHSSSTSINPIYVADRVLVTRDHLPELREFFGPGFDHLAPIAKDVLGVVYRFNRFSTQPLVSAKGASFTLWYDQAGINHADIKAFDQFYRKIRNIFNKLSKSGLLLKKVGKPGGYELNDHFRESHDFLDFGR